jgi:hypothetical protein
MYFYACNLYQKAHIKNQKVKVRQNFATRFCNIDPWTLFAISGRRRSPPEWLHFALEPLDRVGQLRQVGHDFSHDDVITRGVSISHDDVIGRRVSLFSLAAARGDGLLERRDVASQDVAVARRRLKAVPDRAVQRREVALQVVHRFLAMLQKKTELTFFVRLSCLRRS